MTLGNIARKQKILEDLYSYLLQRGLETSISSAATVSNSKILEPAIGYTKPISPDKGKIILLYFMVGLAVPVAAAESAWGESMSFARPAHDGAPGTIQTDRDAQSRAR